MKIKNFLNELISQRHLLVGYILDDTIVLTMDQVIKLSAEITVLTSRIDDILAMPLSKSEEEISMYSVQYESRMHIIVDPVRNRKRKMVPVITSTWERNFFT